MQYDASTPKEYLEQLEKDWRLDKLKVVREMILKAKPDIEEGINYKMLCYNDDFGNAFHLNAQKGYVSLYVGDTKKIDPSGAMLEPFNIGKGCIRIKKSIELDQTRLEEFIKKTLSLRSKGLDTDC